MDSDPEEEEFNVGLSTLLSMVHTFWIICKKKVPMFHLQFSLILMITLCILLILSDCLDNFDKFASTLPRFGFWIQCIELQGPAEARETARNY